MGMDISELAVLKYGEKAVPSFRSEEGALLFREGKKAPIYAVFLTDGATFYAFANKAKTSEKSPDFWSRNKETGNGVSVWLNGETANVVITVAGASSTYKLAITDKALKPKAKEPEAPKPAEAPAAPAIVDVNAKAFANFKGKNKA